MIRALTRRVRYSRKFQQVKELWSLTPQERTLDMAFAFARWGRLQGDYLEFGVFDGWSLTAAYHLSRKHRMSGMRFVGFDSFDGLPASAGIDRFPFEQFSRGDLRCDRATVERNLRRDGVDMSRVALVEGWYSDTLNPAQAQRLALQKAAIVWVDCDLYESTVSVLDFVTPLLQDGTVLIMDDWFLFRAHPERGERRAFTEWLERQADLQVTPFVKAGWHEATFIAHPRGARPAVEALSEQAAAAAVVD